MSDESASEFAIIDPNRKPPFWSACRGIARLFVVLMFDLKAYGIRNVPRTGGALLLSNHQSYLDPICFGVDLPRPLSYLAKSELFENRFLGWLISNLRAFPVRQGKSDKGAIDETIRRLREGHLLQLYPEGSRTEDGEIAPILRGAALVLRRVDVPIVPAVVSGSFDAWPKDRKLPRPRPVRVLYGKPMNVRGMDSRQIVQLIDTTLRTMLADLRAGRVRKYER
jgi:1-acyl-sn-glycerol-3-phosphate acyltransferase